MWEYGKSSLIHVVMKDIVIPLQNSFGDLWEEIYALVLVCIMGHDHLKEHVLYGKNSIP